MSQTNRVEMIREKLSAAFNPTDLDIIDESHKHAGHAGARQGGHFAITIVSNAFQGKNMIERHRMIYKALGDAMKTDIHALSIQAYSEEEL